MSASFFIFFYFRTAVGYHSWGAAGLGVVIFMMRETAEGHEIDARGAGDGAGVCSSFSYLLSWPHPSHSVAFFDILSRGGGLDG